MHHTHLSSSLLVFPDLNEEDEDLPPYSNSQLFALTCGFIGLQFCWAVQIGYVTKALLELGLPPRFVSYAWLAGPIAGIIVQPIVGLMSDRCTSRFGRRRPFLVAGSVISVVFLMVFAYAEQIGLYFGDLEDETVKPCAIFVAVLSFWALDFAINAAQGPVRTLLADVVPPSQHNVGNAFFALATGIGNGTGSLLGSVRLSKFMPFFPGDLHALYFTAAVILVLTMAVTCISTKEVPLNLDAPERNSYHSIESRDFDNDGGAPEQMSYYKAARLAPSPFWSLFTVQFFQWLGWFALIVFATSWVGAEVYNGSFAAPEGTYSRELYDAGVRLGNLGMGLQAIVTVTVSVALPFVIARTSAQFVYAFASVLLGVALTSSLVITEKWQAPLAVTAIASTGFGWAVTLTVPWAIMSEAVVKAAPERAGVYFTMFNLAQACPEVVVALASEEIVRITKRQAAVLAIGGIFAFIASVLTFVFGLGKTKPNQSHSDTS